MLKLSSGRRPALIVLIALVIQCILSAGPTYAQGGGTVSGGIAGRVVDDTGAVLPGASVTATNMATNQTRTVVTNQEGSYLMSGLPPSQYSVKVELAGFSTVTTNGVTLNVGITVDVNVTMRLSSLNESITVTGEAPLIESSKTELGTVITQEQIETLPANSRNYLDFALLTPATVDNFSTTSQGIGLNIGGARAKEGSLLVDGFWNTDESFTFPRQLYSQDAIQEFKVNSFGAPAEYGRAIGGVVTAVTKSGSNSPSGSAYGFFRDTGLNAQGFLEKARGTPKKTFSRQLFGGTFGGPIVRDRTFFFGAIERKDQKTPTDNNITAANAAALGLPAADVGALGGVDQSTFVMGKITHNASSKNTLTATVAYTRDSNSNVAITPFATRSRQLRILPYDWAGQLLWTNIIGNGGWLNEWKVAYFPRSYTLDNPDEGGPPLTADGQLRSSHAPSVSITNVALFGGGRVSNQMSTRPVQAIYSATLSRRGHAIKFGADALLVDFEYDLYGGPDSGTYTFGSLAAYQAGRWTQYTQRFGDPVEPLFHAYYSGYVQDTWEAGARLSINYGIRYDFDAVGKYKGGADYGSDFNNFGPRFGLSYDLTGHQRTFLKLSAGVYYDRLFQNPVEPTFLQLKSNPQQVTATWIFGQVGAPVYPLTFNSINLPADAPRSVQNVYLLPDVMQIPASNQVVGTVEHAFASDFAVSGSVLYSKSRNKEMFFDRNIGFNNDTQKFVRIDPNYRAINQYSYVGRADYLGLAIDARKRMRNKVNVDGNVTVSRSRDQGNNFSSVPTDQRFPENEYGPAADTPTVRFVLNGAYEINRFAQVSAIYRWRSGYAFDPVAGPTFDLNGDGNFNDRVPGFTRNSFRGPSVNSLDARFTWNVPLGTGKGKVQLMLETFNLFNQANVLTESSIYGPTPGQPIATFLTPLTYYPPREVQLGARLAF